MPYLAVDEQSTYFQVFCDGYSAINYISGGSGTGAIADVNDSVLYTFVSGNIISATTYLLFYDTTRVTTLVENSPTRVVIRVKGNPDDTFGAGGSTITNSTSRTLTFYYYTDKIFVKVEQENSGTITLGSGITDQFFFSLLGIRGNLTSEANYYENNGIESVASADTAYNSADYLITTATELNLQNLLLDELHSGTASIVQVFSDDAEANLGWYDGTLLTGIHTLTYGFILDSADREGSAQKYDTVAKRIKLAEQHKSLVL